MLKKFAWSWKSLTKLEELRRSLNVKGLCKNKACSAFNSMVVCNLMKCLLNAMSIECNGLGPTLSKQCNTYSSVPCFILVSMCSVSVKVMKIWHATSKVDGNQ